MNIKNVLTIKQVATRFGVTEETINSWREAGMPVIKIGKSIFVLESSLVSWMKGIEISHETTKGR